MSQVFFQGNASIIQSDGLKVRFASIYLTRFVTGVYHKVRKNDV
jgi:hypothetical protein